mgnify:CR=1 FL=1
MSTKPDLTNLFEKIKDLSPPDKLRLAAELLEQRRVILARTIARQVADELGAVLALSKG